MCEDRTSAAADPQIGVKTPKVQAMNKQRRCTSRFRQWWKERRPSAAERVLRRFIASEDGPSATEYAILLGALIVGAMATIGAMGSSMDDIYVTIDAAVAAAGI